MTQAQRPDSALTDLITSIEHLAILGRELQASNGDSPPLLLSEMDETLAEAGLALKRLTDGSAGVAGLGAEGAERGVDPLSIAYTVGITTVILPFVQGIVQRAGEDFYEKMTGLIRRRRRQSLPAAEPTTVVLGDRDTNTHVLIDARVDSAAIAELQRLDLTDDRLRDATLRWNPDHRAWEAQKARPDVNLWLPGDPLDDMP
jgi:hypothetical protein